MNLLTGLNKISASLSRVLTHAPCLVAVRGAETSSPSHVQSNLHLAKAIYYQKGASEHSKRHYLRETHISIYNNLIEVIQTCQEFLWDWQGFYLKLWVSFVLTLNAAPPVSVIVTINCGNCSFSRLCHTGSATVVTFFRNAWFLYSCDTSLKPQRS